MRYFFTFLLLLIYGLCTSQEKPQLSTAYSQPEYLLNKAKEASSLREKGYYDSSIHILKNLLPLFPKKDYITRSKIYNELGISYLSKGDMETGIQTFLLSALLLNEKEEEHFSDLATIFNNITLLLTNTKDYKEALVYSKKAEKMTIANKDMGDLARIYINRGRIYQRIGKMDKGLAYFQRSLFLLDSLVQYDTTVDIAAIKKEQRIVHINLGQFFGKMQQYHKAIKHGMEALHLKSEPIDPFNHIPNLQLLGNAYLMINEYSLSEKYIQEAQSLSIQHNRMEGICESAYSLAVLYNNTGRYRLAFDNYRIFKKFDDSIRSLDKMNSVKNMEIKYRVAEKDKEIMAARLKTLKQERALKNRNFSILLVSSIALLAIVSLIFISRSYRQKEKLRKQDLLTAQQDKKIAVMKATIEGEENERSRIAESLHDGIGSIISAAKMNFSTVHSAGYIPNNNIFENGLTLLDEAAMEIRNTAHNLMPEKLLIDGLEAAVTSYCERISNKEALDIEGEFNGTFDNLDKDIALLTYRIVQELINNILKHAQASKVFVQLNYVNGLLNLAVEDNGNGITDERISGNSGMGLKTIREKISALNGLMTIQSTPGKGTQVYIDLDC